MTVKLPRRGPSGPLPSHPGETLLELLEERCLTQAWLASRLGVTPSYICDVLHGRRDVTARLAVKLEALPRFPSAEFWCGLQVARDLAQARMEAT